MAAIVVGHARISLTMMALGDVGKVLKSLKKLQAMSAQEAQAGKTTHTFSHVSLTAVALIED